MCTPKVDFMSTIFLQGSFVLFGSIIKLDITEEVSFNADFVSLIPIQ